MRDGQRLLQRNGVRGVVDDAMPAVSGAARINIGTRITFAAAASAAGTSIGSTSGTSDHRQQQKRPSPIRTSKQPVVVDTRCDRHIMVSAPPEGALPMSCRRVV